MVGGRSLAELKVGSTDYPMTFPQNMIFNIVFMWKLFHFVEFLVTHFAVWRREIIIKI